MKISYAPYQRKFAKPFHYGNGVMEERTGLVLRFEAPGGTYYSEASPLPGHSKESLDEVVSALRAHKNEELVLFVMGEGSLNLPPSLRFALESFLAQIQVQIGPVHPVQTNALVPWLGANSTAEEIQKKQEAGFRTIKLKALNENAAELPDLLSRFSESGLSFRLDGNRALSEESLAVLFSGLKKLKPGLVEYLEEPFSHWRHPLLADAPVALAADECAADPAFWKVLLRQPNSPSVFVIKPSVSGGLFSLVEKAKILRDAGKKIVFTSSLEAEPGRRALLSFLMLLPQELAAGISTGFLFSENFLPDQPDFRELPPVSEAESGWLTSLKWEEVKE